MRGWSVRVAHMPAVDEALAWFLRHRMPEAEDTAVWADGTIPLRITAYLTAEEPPSSYVTSVRGIVVRDETVLVLWNEQDEPYLLPGGRCEPGESLQETLHREVLEEAGVEVHDPAMLGFLRHHHLGPKPSGYLYPYPDFLQVVYLARAGPDRPDRKVHDDYVSRSAFVPLTDIQTLPLCRSDRLYVAAALARLSDRAL